MSNRTGWGALAWSEAESLEELAFLTAMMDSMMPEVMQALIANFGGHLFVPSYWKEPIR